MTLFVMPDDHAGKSMRNAVQRSAPDASVFTSSSKSGGRTFSFSIDAILYVPSAFALLKRAIRSASWRQEPGVTPLSLPHSSAKPPASVFCMILQACLLLSFQTDTNAIGRATFE